MSLVGTKRNSECRTKLVPSIRKARQVINCNDHKQMLRRVLGIQQMSGHLAANVARQTKIVNRKRSAKQRMQYARATGVKKESGDHHATQETMELNVKEAEKGTVRGKAKARRCRHACHR